jgi:hypothetical protein
VAVATYIRSLVSPSSGELIIVKNGESIQGAVVAASPGTVITVMSGTDKETVYIDKDNITLSGIIEQGKYPVLEGEGLRYDAALYAGSAVMGQAGKNFIVRNNVIVDTDVYGIFSQPGKNGIVSHNIVSGMEDVVF